MERLKYQIELDTSTLQSQLLAMQSTISSSMASLTAGINTATGYAGSAGQAALTAGSAFSQGYQNLGGSLPSIMPQMAYKPGMGVQAQFDIPSAIAGAIAPGLMSPSGISSSVYGRASKNYLQNRAADVGLIGGAALAASLGSLAMWNTFGEIGGGIGKALALAGGATKGGLIHSTAGVIGGLAAPMAIGAGIFKAVDWAGDYVETKNQGLAMGLNRHEAYKLAGKIRGYTPGDIFGVEDMFNSFIGDYTSEEKSSALSFYHKNKLINTKGGADAIVDKLDKLLDEAKYQSQILKVDIATAMQQQIVQDQLGYTTTAERRRFASSVAGAASLSGMSSSDVMANAVNAAQGALATGGDIQTASDLAVYNTQLGGLSAAASPYLRNRYGKSAGKVITAAVQQWQGALADNPLSEYAYISGEGNINAGFANLGRAPGGAMDIGEYARYRREFHQKKGKLSKNMIQHYLGITEKLLSMSGISSGDKNYEHLKALIMNRRFGVSYSDFDKLTSTTKESVQSATENAELQTQIDSGYKSFKGGFWTGLVGGYKVDTELSISGMGTDKMEFVNKLTKAIYKEEGLDKFVKAKDYKGFQNAWVSKMGAGQGDNSLANMLGTGKIEEEDLQDYLKYIRGHIEEELLRPNTTVSSAINYLTRSYKNTYDIEKKLDPLSLTDTERRERHNQMSNLEKHMGKYSSMYENLAKYSLTSIKDRKIPLLGDWVGTGSSNSGGSFSEDQFNKLMTVLQEIADKD